MRTLVHKALPAYAITLFALFFLTMLLYLLHIDNWDHEVILLITGAMIFYPFLATMAVLLPALLARVICSKLPEKHRTTITWCSAALTAFAVHIFLLFDAGLYLRYDYHINPHIINIFTTPGGFEAMGMRPNEIVLLACAVVFLLAFHAVLCWCFARFSVLSFAGSWQLTRDRKSWYRYIITAVLAAAGFILSYITYTYEHFTMDPAALLAARAIPFYITGTSSSLYKSIGIDRPSRNAVQLQLAENRHLANYPVNPIRRSDAKKKRYNIVWLTCESLANRLFTPHIMPNTTAFARNGVVFKKHYSGGNVTRQGMFSQFYALPGNYWHAFLAARRGPLFIDWLLEDGYLMDCITSSKFTYPEFDQTIFFRVPTQSMHSDFSGRTFERDQRNLARLLANIERNAASGKPFFSFMFFESTHHPYEFPPEATLFPDYINPFNAASVTPADAPAIFKRAANSAFHLDMLLGKVFALLKKLHLLDNTIVIIAGDHGEEYFEKGFLGHSSKFNEEQTRTPFILYYPGITPGVYERMSSHLDIIPLIAHHFGVENPPEDYSCGIDLFSPSSSRRYSLIANWDELFFVGEKYKSLIPLNPVSFARQTVTDANDNPIDAVDDFYALYNADLVKVQKEISRFTSDDDDTPSPASQAPSLSGKIILSAVILLLLASAIVCYHRRRRIST